jgi:hypothetical protein
VIPITWYSEKANYTSSKKVRSFQDLKARIYKQSREFLGQ